MAVRWLACATWLAWAHGAALGEPQAPSPVPAQVPPQSPPGPAQPAPQAAPRDTLPAKLFEDVDGDGSPDAIELEGDGVLRIGGKPRGVVRLAPAIAEGELAVARYRGKRYVVAQIVVVAPPAPPGSPVMQREAVIVSSEGGAWRVRLSLLLGGIGLDHDYALALDVTADGIFRYQTRSDIRRCDGKPGYLFAEKFDGVGFRRASALPSNVPDGVPMLQARLDTASAAPPVVYQAHAASFEVGVGDAGGLVIPRELDDGQLDTVWREELAASAGEGQFFTFEPRTASAAARQLRIVPGNPASSATMKRFNRPRRLAVVAAHGAWRFELPDAANDPLGAAYVVDLPQPVTGCVTVILESTYGAPQGTTAIAELEVFADGERGAGGDTLLAHVVAEGSPGATTAAAALGRRGAAGAAAIDAEIAATHDAGARRRLIGALVGIADPAAGPTLARAATSGWVRDRDLLDVIGALGALGKAQELHDLAARGALPVAARAAAVAQLPTSEPGFALLVDLAGTGAPELRRAVIERLSLAPAAALLGAVAAQGSAPAAGDLWRAMTRSVRHTPANRAPVLAAMLAALPAATDYERRYRLIDGIAALGDAAAIATLDALFRALPAAPETAALRQVAVRAIATTPRPEAGRFALDSARDRDPGVRLAALAALSAADADARLAPGAGGEGAIDRAIAGALAGDGWPEVRRRAAAALGSRCQRPAPAAALGDAVDRDRDVRVRGDALAGLVQCHAPGTAERLAQIWDDGKAPLELRSRAVLEAVALGDRKLAAALVGRFTRWRGQALESAAALALAQSAAASIARLDAPGAARALADALDDTAFPEIVQAAALGLGALGAACPPEARAKLQALAASEGETAIAAKRAARQCGR